MIGILVTGITSGLGKFLHRHYKCDGWQRAQPMPNKYYDVIIHCAHDIEEPSSNMDMMQRLFTVPCGRFIYISSIDVHKVGSLDNRLYGQSKLRCEQFVRSSYDDYLIIRPGVMLGKDSRKNTIIKLVKDEKLSVTPDSTFGILRHESLLPFIESGANGTVTVSGGSLSVKEIAEELGFAPEYGVFPYMTPPVKPTHDTMTEIKEFLRD